MHIGLLGHTCHRVPEVPILHHEKQHNMDLLSTYKTLSKYTYMKNIKQEEKTCRLYYTKWVSIRIHVAVFTKLNGNKLNHTNRKRKTFATPFFWSVSLEKAKNKWKYQPFTIIYICFLSFMHQINEGKVNLKANSWVTTTFLLGHQKKMCF